MVISSQQHPDNCIWSFVALDTFPKALGPRFLEWLEQHQWDEDMQIKMKTDFVQHNGAKLEERVILKMLTLLE